MQVGRHAPLARLRWPAGVSRQCLVFLALISCSVGLARGASIRLAGTLISSSLPSDVTLNIPISFATGNTERVLPVSFQCGGSDCKAALELSPGSWVLRSQEGTGYWIRPLPLAVTEENQSVTGVEIFRLEEVQFQLRARVLADSVAKARIRFRFPGRSSLVFFEAGACELSGTKCTCRLPWVPLDLRLEAEGFVPMHFWGVTPPFHLGGDRKLVEMERGASVSGWVDGSREGKDPVEIELVELLKNSLEVAKRSSAGGTAKGVEPGLAFFVVGPVAAGRYEVDVAQAGTLGARFRVLTLQKQESAFIPSAIRLDQGQGALQVRVFPPRTPEDGEWKLRLLYFNGPPQTAELAGEWPFQGSTTLTNLAPGDYRLTLMDGQRTAWVDEALEIGQHLVSRDYRLGEALQVVGSVLLGEELLPDAELLFGQGMLRAKFTSDRQGSFSGSLPREGIWKVTVRCRDPQLHRGVEVAVKRPATGERAEIEVQLPGGGFAGLVEHEDGRPAARASVNLTRLDNDEQSLGWVSTGENGRFEHRGLSPGRYSVSAQGVWETAEASSDLVVEISEGSATQDVKLQLHPKLVVKGIVSDPNGPLPGAALFFLSARNPLASIQEEAISGANGTFEIPLAANSFPLLVTVVAAGHPTIVLARAASQGPLNVFVPLESASVIVDDPRPPGGDRQRRQLVLIREGLPLLEGWTPGFRGYLQGAQSPPVEATVLPGRYLACSGSMAEIQQLLVSGLGDRRLSCAAGDVGFGGSLVLHLEPPAPLP